MTWSVGWTRALGERGDSGTDSRIALRKSTHRGMPPSKTTMFARREAGRVVHHRHSVTERPSLTLAAWAARIGEVVARQVEVERD